MGGGRESATVMSGRCYAGRGREQIKGGESQRTVETKKEAINIVALYLDINVVVYYFSVFSPRTADIYVMLMNKNVTN